MKDNNYVVIEGWMISKLHLKGNELITYALIYGFCQDEESYYSGSISYLCDWLGCARSTAISVLKDLTDKGLIVKHSFVVNKVKLNRYTISVPVVVNSDGGSAKTLPNITKDITNNIYIEQNAENKPKKVKHRYGEYKNVLLSDDEIEKLKAEITDYPEWIERLSCYLAEKNVSYKSHYIVIRNWSNREKKKGAYRNGTTNEVNEVNGIKF